MRSSKFVSSSNRRRFFPRRRPRGSIPRGPRTRLVAADKGVSIWHYDPRERLGVENGVIGHKLIQEQHIGADRVDLVRRQGLGSVERHRAANEVVKRRGEGPIASDRLDRPRRPDGARPPTSRSIGLPSPGRHDRPHISRRKSLRPRDAAAPGRQAGSVRRDVDVPAGDLARARGAANAESSPAKAMPAPAASQASNRGASSELTGIGHASIFGDVPGLDRIVMVVGAGVALLQRALRGSAGRSRSRRSPGSTAPPARRSSATAAGIASRHFDNTGSCKIASAQVAPPSALTSTRTILPRPDQATPESRESPCAVSLRRPKAR